MSDLVSTFRSYALDKDNCPRMDTEVVYVRVGLLKEAADRIEQLEAALIDAVASLAAAISLLERGGKKAAASDKMFAVMLSDYQKSMDRARAAVEDRT